MSPIDYYKYKSAENYFESIANTGTENFFTGQADPQFLLQRAKYFLKMAGHPDHAFKIIHIAGTSGKGTTTHYCASILKSAGYKVGHHVSPFVSVATEKIQVNGKFISVKDFIALVDEMKPVIEKVYQKMGPPSFFECWVVAALLYFKKQKVDYAVMETGCGGRFDATNAVTKTELSLITNIGLDHTHILGNTIAKIAYEKAGIIRPRGRVITTTDRPAALKVIARVATEKKATLEVIRSTANPNQALARRVGEYVNVQEPAMEKIFQQTQLPARFEIMQTRSHVIIDGAHNKDKIQYLVNELRKKFPDIATRRVHIVCALADKKTPRDVFAAFHEIPRHKIYATRFTNPFRKAVDPKIIASADKKNSAGVYLDPYQAFNKAHSAASTRDIIVITGSFFLCSNLRTHWIDEVSQLEQQTGFPKS